MPTSESTCWTMIRGAAAGDPAEREELAHRYLGIVRSYLAARWRATALQEELDDASQAMFVECFRHGGVLDAAGVEGVFPVFRAFLYGVIRNVARRFESRRVRAAELVPEIAIDDSSQSRLFDRTWAGQAIIARPVSCKASGPKSTAQEAVRRPSSCCGCGWKKTCRLEKSPAAGPPIRRPFTSPMPLPEKSFGRPSWRSSRSTIRAARSSWQRKPRAS